VQSSPSNPDERAKIKRMIALTEKGYRQQIMRAADAGSANKPKH